MKKAAGIIYFLAFLCMLIVPLATIDTRHNVTSEADNRMLTEFPQNGEMFATQFKSYLEDRIGFRKEMMQGYASLNQAAFGILEHPLYEYGKDGYVFFKMHDNIQFSEYHQLFADSVVKMKEYCEQRGVPFYFVFNPEKSSVYRRYLPEGFRYDDSWTDRLLANLEERGVDCVNNKELLTEKSYKEQVFNRQYDAGHWNALGAFYGTNHLWEHMHKDFPAVAEYTPEDFTISTQIESYYPVSVIPVNETVPEYTLKRLLTERTNDYAGIELNPEYRYFRVYSNPDASAEKLPRVLFFHGSYYNKMPAFLMGKVREYIGVHDYQNVLNLDYYFNIFQPDAVVFEVAEYTLENSYFSREKMLELDYNPGIQGESSGQISGQEAAEEVYIKPGEKLDIVSWDTSEDADYAYLLSDGKVYDLRRTGTGLFQATVPHNAVYGAPVLCAKNGNEDTFLPVHLTGGQKNRKGLSFSSGTRYDEDGDCFILEPKGEALFSGVDLQLFDAVSGQYLDTILTVHAADSYRGTYLHERGTGNYIIRLKANSSIEDEYIDMEIGLTEGSVYRYYFSLEEFSAWKVLVNAFRVGKAN